MSFTVNAQSRSRNGSNSSSRTGTATVKKSNDSKNARTTLNYNRRSTNNSNEGRFIERNEKPQTQNYTYKSSGYKNHEPVHYNNHAYVKPFHYKKHYHPAPWTYYNYPVVFYHNDFGEYYYHNGRFYRYNRRHGYYAIDFPIDIYFRTIPVGYSRVYINGHLFYRYNGIYFRHTPFGYQVVPRSSGIYITASF